MEKWKNFEVSCADYLNKNFGTYARFALQGGSDSTVSDILVETKSGKTFYIDAKHSPAQCGQFVLLPDTSSRAFEYSDQNANRINTHSTKIMEYMNKEFDEFRKAGTKGKIIEMKNGSHIFSEWIIQTYKDKGTKLFITNNYTILPIEQFSEYFKVTAKYRIKRSGSANVGKSKLTQILNHINTLAYIITSSRAYNDKLFVQSNQNLHGKRFTYMQSEYMFSQRHSEYEIRKLSDTRNSNVIFSIKLIAAKSGLSDADFINLLQ